MSGLFDSLGLGNVESDPNNLPDGKWPGEVYKSELVEKKNGEVAHVITYRVTDGDYAGKQRSEWFTLGTTAKKDETGKVVGFETPTMSEDQKSWYKLRLENLHGQVTNEYHPSHSVGKKVFFGTKRNGGYININFVELRPEASPEAPAADPSNVMGSL